VTPTGSGFIRAVGEPLVEKKDKKTGQITISIGRKIKEKKLISAIG
jgi:hypothetical protein